MTLQLVDCSIVNSVGILEEFLIKVGKIYIPTDFVVMEMEEEEDSLSSNVFRETFPLHCRCHN